MDVVGLGAVFDEKGQLATFALEGWKQGMPVEANPDVFIEIASDEPPPAENASDTFKMRTQKLTAVVDLIRRRLSSRTGRELPLPVRNDEGSASPGV